MKMDEFYSKLAINDDSLFFPSFNSKDVIIDNLEDGYKLTLLNYTQIDLNEVAYMVLNLCNGELPIAQIINEMVKMYDAPLDLIQRDTYKILYDFWTNSIITWKGGKNFYSVLYEEKFGDEYRFKMPVLRESLDIINKLTEKMLYDVRYCSEIKFSSAYIEKSMKTKETRFLECWYQGELIIMYSCTPDKSYINNLEIISFSLDGIYVNVDKMKEVRAIWNDFALWVVKWFGKADNSGKNVFNIMLEDNAAEALLDNLSFKKITCNGIEANFYEKIIE